MDDARLRSIAASVVLLISTALLAGCGLFTSDEAPKSFVGSWSSTDGKSFLQLNADQSGSFTMCEPDDYDGNLRYNFVAEAWPARIPVEWERPKTSASDRSTRLYLNQDWNLRQRTGTGFNSVDVILEWRNGALEMGADLVVRYVPASDSEAPCERSTE